MFYCCKSDFSLYLRHLYRLTWFCSFKSDFSLYFTDCRVLLFFCDVNNWNPDYKVCHNSRNSCDTLLHMGHTQRFSRQVFLKGAPVSVGENNSSLVAVKTRLNVDYFFLIAEQPLMSISTISFIAYWYPLYLLTSYQ